MSEMVERVAKAIHAEAYKTRDDSRMPDWMAVARAAIQTMREPTEDMKIHDESNRWEWNCHTCGGPKENWQAFIDAALNEKSPATPAKG